MKILGSGIRLALVASTLSCLCGFGHLVQVQDTGERVIFDVNPAQFKVITPEYFKTTLVCISNFPISLDNKESRFFVAILIRHSPNPPWSTEINANNAVIGLKGKSKIQSSYVAFGAGASFEFHGSRPVYNFKSIESSNLIIESYGKKINTTPIIIAEVREEPIVDKVRMAESVVWLIFPYKGNIQEIEYMELENVQVKRR